MNPLISLDGILVICVQYFNVEMHSSDGVCVYLITTTQFLVICILNLNTMRWQAIIKIFCFPHGRLLLQVIELGKRRGLKS